jgi:GNAT superfamily N-acetyltransferase
MNWQIAEKSTFAGIRSFLSEHECSCVSFSSRFKTYTSFFEGRREQHVVLVDREPDTGIVRNAVLVTQGGLILPVFDDPFLSVSQTEIPVLREMFSQFSEILHSIMGTLKSVSVMQGLFAEKPSHFIDYYLLSLAKPKFIAPGGTKIAGLTIRQATVKDAERLFPLQKEYELEEVYIDPTRFNERFCMSNLRQTLRKEIVLVAESNGEIIAKAGTNARGYLFDQIGGVYTVKEMRRKGVGTVLVAGLIENISRRRMNTCLFVKKINTGAVTMYTKLGFSFEDDFRIAYYFNNPLYRRD